MAKKTQSMPEGQWAPVPRDVLRSDAWRSLGINDRRFIDFLLLEHMRHGGKQNGNLKAPYRQLRDFGIGEHFTAEAIRRAEERGLILCNRQGLRTATTYAIAWLPGADGTWPEDRWKDFRDPSLRPLPEQKIRNLPAKQHAGLPAKQHADGPNLPAKQHSDGAKSLRAKQHSPYRKDLPTDRKVGRAGIDEPSRMRVVVGGVR